MTAMQETEHARKRRAERGIDRKDLQAALNHGVELPCRYGRKYTYNDLTYIVAWNGKREITCYANRLKLKKVNVTNEIKKIYNAAKVGLKDLSRWKSNTVIVVDTSGSMRESDIWGAGCRLEAVWVCVALDFIAHRLECGDAGPYDVISIICMGENGHAFIETHPTTWETYNIIVDIYTTRRVPAKGHGCYVPSLKIAERILTCNKSSSCALALCFLSDGRPSDHGNARESILERVEGLGTRFGRRLSFTAVGIGDDSTEFEMLKSMVDVAKDFGVQSFFVLPSMTTSSLGVSLTSTATTLTKTQTEMTDMKTLKQRNVREVLRESKRKASEEVVSVVAPEDYWLYPNYKVVRRIYREWHDEDRKRRHSYDVAPMQHPHAMYVALNKKVFGEGAERYAFRFFEVDEDGMTVVGKPLVAKESRLVLDGGEEDREKFVQTFCQTQQLARRIANEFNQKLDSLRRVEQGTPRVTFLDCSVYELDDANLGKQSVLVEEKIDDAKWHKWNMNNGYVEGMAEAPEFTHGKMKAALDHLARIGDDGMEPIGAKRGMGDLDVIAEGDEDELEDSTGSSALVDAEITPIKFSASEVAQAFSHYSYLATGRKRLICDLQGVYDESSNTLKFTDPVIHYFNDRRQERENVHGGTDHGRKGMAMFFDTHKDCCGHLCRLVTGGFKRDHRRYGRDTNRHRK